MKPAIGQQPPAAGHSENELILKRAMRRIDYGGKLKAT
jgi:hypothetical protein